MAVEMAAGATVELVGSIKEYSIGKPIGRDNNCRNRIDFTRPTRHL